MEAVFQDCIKTEKQRGRTVLLSSHILSEVEALCDRVSIIRSGAVVETGTLSELRHLTRTAITAELASLPPLLQASPGVHDLVVEGNRTRFDVDSAELDRMLRTLVESGVRSLTATPPTLEELFLRHYGDRVGPDAGGTEVARPHGARRLSGRHEKAAVR
jgi:ABC-2 type transport system ATP-binding protein